MAFRAMRQKYGHTGVQVFVVLRVGDVDPGSGETVERDAAQFIPAGTAHKANAGSKHAEIVCKDRRRAAERRHEV